MLGGAILASSEALATAPKAMALQDEARRQAFVAALDRFSSPLAIAAP
jgi:hypothetical protein